MRFCTWAEALAEVKGKIERRKLAKGEVSCLSKIQNLKRALDDMTEEKWQAVVGRLKDDCEILEHQTINGEKEGEKIEEIIFENPIGRMKLTRRTKPRLLGEKTHYSGRVGQSTNVERVYSDDEFVDTVELFQDNNGEWVPVDNSSFA
ncbi:hypothetical protein BK004_01155 [bacterium CG10_46_32]|nr:MAG: hypothetical protein BK004_01155 [bacterium CG10_46_32]PIR56306.1 MAG: hypothetical protein COU73_01170 [Parcubacteria group bacterium CG10_big_fil_rev_8_21_14_0_10_46_32]